MSERQDAADKLAEQEANALAELLTIKGQRTALVVVIMSEGDKGSICRGVSKETIKRDALNFMAGLGREYERIRSKSGVGQ